MSDKLAVPETTIREAPRERELKQGQWYWVKEKDGEWLGCVTHIGSNYAEITSAYGGYSRIPFDGWDDHIARIEPNAHEEEAAVEHELHENHCTGLSRRRQVDRQGSDC